MSTDTPPPCCAGAGAGAGAGSFAGAPAVVLKESWQTTGQPLQAALQSLRQLPSAARGDAASTTKHSTAAAACTLVAAISDLISPHGRPHALACCSRYARARVQGEEDKIGGRDDAAAAGPGSDR